LNKILNLPVQMKVLKITSFVKKLLLTGNIANPRIIKFNNLNFSFLRKNSNSTNQTNVNNNKKYNKPPPIDLKSIRVEQTESSEQPKITSRIVSLAFLSIPIITFGLGVWQVRRREWKLNLIKFLEERTKSQPIELPTDEEQLKNLVETKEYHPFKVRGHFLHSKEIIITVRPDLTGSIRVPGGHVITPFVVKNKPNLIILVNRGFVPYYNYSPTKRQHAQIEDELEIIGLLRSNEIKNSFTPENKPPFEWHNRNVDEIARTLGTTPIFLDAVESCTIKGGPIAGQTAINLRNDHLSYIITWFTLSGLTSFLWWKRFAFSLI
jgi:surfeit locus 1 family protein